MASLNNRLLELRTKRCGERGATQFARKAGISPATYHGWERETQPTADGIARICEAWGANPGWLLLGKGEMLQAENMGVREGEENYAGKCPVCGYNKDAAEKYRSAKRTIGILINLLPDDFREEILEQAKKERKAGKNGNRANEGELP